MGGVIHRVLCTWQLIGLAVKGPCMVGTGWANFHPGCMNRLRKRSSHLLGGSFLTGKASWAHSGCLSSKTIADYCMVISKWAWLRSRVCLKSLKVHLGSVLESEPR